jgi:hypothetical protein
MLPNTVMTATFLTVRSYPISRIAMRRRYRRRSTPAEPVVHQRRFPGWSAAEGAEEGDSEHRDRNEAETAGRS